MKTILKATLATVCVASLIALPTTAAAQQKKGAELQMELATLHTGEDVDSLDTGDSVAMACAKCKTIWVAKVVRPVAGGRGATLLKSKGKQTKLVGVHECKGCKGQLTLTTTTGHSKGASVRLLKHSCSSCGDESAFCCATKKTSGPTKGMEKNKDK